MVVSTSEHISLCYLLFFFEGCQLLGSDGKAVSMLSVIFNPADPEI